MAVDPVGKSDGLFVVIDRRNVRGLRHWADELEKREIPALILIDEYMTDEHGDLIKDLSHRGFEIGGWYQEDPFWDKPYGFQYEKMDRIKQKIQSSTDRSIRIFGSKYFAYDELTLGIADELGIEYVTARGTTGARSVVYKAEEYKPKIISVSSVPWKDKGSGSLCEYSLWCRNAAPDDFREIIFQLSEEKIILIAQTHLSGVKLHWWNVYQDVLNSNRFTWKPLEEFAVNPIVLPYAEIPVNTEVKYVTPQPRIPLEEEPDCPLTDR